MGEQVIQDMTAFEERLGRITSLDKLHGSAYASSRVCSGLGVWVQGLGFRV